MVERKKSPSKNMFVGSLARSETVHHFPSFCDGIFRLECAGYFRKFVRRILQWRSPRNCIFGEYFQRQVAS